MNYSSIITSKGTITIPAHLRRQLNLKPGNQVNFLADSTGKTIKIRPALSWKELQQQNQAILKRRGNWPPKPYKSGAGFEAYVAEKYGKKSLNWRQRPA